MEIVLTQGFVSIVDDSDAELVVGKKWHAIRNGRKVYASTYNSKTSSNIRLHRLLLGAVKGQLVDHKNGDGLDNRRDNLRFCDHSTNRVNSPTKRGYSSQYKGVHYSKADSIWISSIGYQGVYHYLGRYKSEEEAALAYNRGALKFFGDFACINVVTKISGEAA